MTIKTPQKTQKQYICEKCNFLTVNKKDYSRHILTSKHLNIHNTSINKNIISDYNKSNKNNDKSKNLFTCECGKIYPYRSSLFNHKKKCIIVDNTKLIQNENHEELKELVCKLMNESNEIKTTLIEENKALKEQLTNKDKQIDELIPKIGDNIITNNYNQNYNINIFLNEKCKDALNMNEFIEKIQTSINLIDFKNQENLTEELNELILYNINKLGIFKRPLHCTDIKRETLYIKDNNSWFKDDKKNNIKKVIKTATSHQYKALHKWIDENQDIHDDENKKDCFAKNLSSLGKDNSKINTKLIKSLCSTTYLKDKHLNSKGL